MRPRKSKRIALALIGTLAAVVVPFSGSAPAWADDAPAKASTEPSQAQWAQLDKIAKLHSALGVAASGAVVRLPAGTSAEEKAKTEAQIPAGVHAVVKASRFSANNLDQIQKTVTALKWNRDADKYGVGVEYDAKADKIVVDTDAPASVTKSLSDAYPGAIEVRQSRFEPQLSRFDDSQPFWGGAAIIGGSNGMCTTGFTVKETATNHLYMTTAGHCYSAGAHVYARRTDNSWGNWVGQVNRRNQNLDIEMLYASSSVAYGLDIYTGGTQTSGSYDFVHGTQWPDMGMKVCVSGSVSFDHCGHPITNNHFSICFSGGNCIKNGAGFLYDRGGDNWPNYNNGKVTQGGDSGAPIFTEDHTSSAAWIVGSHSGIKWDDCCHPHMIGVNVYKIVSGMGVNVVTK